MMQSSQVGAGQGEGCGSRLRQARETAGLTHEQVSARLKVPVRVVRALEADDWSLLGAPVFVRGQLRSFARLLHLDIEADITGAVGQVAAPAVLVSHTHTPRFRRIAEQVTRRAIYIAVTAALAVPVWIVTSPHLANTNPVLQSLDPPAPAVDATVAASASVTGSTLNVAVPRTPLIASFAPAATPPVASTPTLALTFNNDSWIQVFAADGRALEQGLVRAGQSRHYQAREAARLVIGNAAAVTVLQAGRPVDLSPFSRANVARITLSSDGSLAPVVP